MPSSPEDLLVPIEPTQQQLAEQMLRESEELFRHIFEQGPIAMALIGVDLRFQVVNQALCDMLGYGRDELLGLDVYAVTHPDDIRASAARNDAMVCGEIPGFSAEKRYLHKNGAVVWARITTSFILGEQSRPKQAVTIFENVTQQKHAADELQRSNRALKTLIEQSPIAIVLYDVEGRAQRWNPAAEKLMGWTPDDARAVRATEDPGYVSGQFKDIWERAVAGEDFRGVEVSRRRKDGSRIDMAVWTAVYRDASGEPPSVLALFADVSEQRRHKEQLLDSQKMESIGRLAGGVAHDFNNLLAVISGYSEGLLRRLGEQSPLRGHVVEIYRAATRGAGLTQQLLAFSRRQAITPRLLDLNLLVASVHQMLRRVISEGIDIAIEGASEPRWVRADPSQMEQVLVNLALNARDAMEVSVPPGAPLGAPEPTGRIVITTATLDLDTAAAGDEWLTAGRYVLLSVTDTGAGIDEETCSHIFEPFFTTKEGKGTGLGLSIVYGIVQQCGGNISVHSNPGRGTQFKIFLPEERQADLV